MNLFIRPLTILSAVVLSTTMACAQSAVTINQQWQVGKRYTQNMKMTQTTSITLGEMKMDQKMDISTDMTLAVTKHEDPKHKRIAVKYIHMAMETDMGGQKMSFDSAKPDAAPSPMGNPLTAIVNKEFRLVTDETDKVIDFENFDELAKTAGADNPMAAGFLSKDAISQTLRQGGLLALPSKPVKPGDNWPFSVEMPLPQLGKVIVKGTYTFQKTSERNGVQCMEIAFAGTLNMDAAAAGADSPMAKLGMKIEKASMTGTIWFDNALGAARGSELSQDMSMLMNNPTKPGETMKLPVKQLIVTTLSKVEALP